MKKRFLIAIATVISLSESVFAAKYLAEKKIVRIEAVSHPSVQGSFFQLDSTINTGLECSPSVETDTVFLDKSLDNYNAIMSIALAAYTTSNSVRLVTAGCGELHNNETVIKPTAVRVHGISAVQ